MKTLLSLVAIFALSACATNLAPNWEGTFGDASREARLAQTINPHAGLNTSLGQTDGKAVAGAQTTYSRSFGYGVKAASPAMVVTPTK